MFIRESEHHTSAVVDPWLLRFDLNSDLTHFVKAANETHAANEFVGRAVRGFAQANGGL
jgi:hypothetical protein